VQVGGEVYQLAKYRVDVDGPRPESYVEDYQLAQQLPPQQVTTLVHDHKLDKGRQFLNWLDHMLKIPEIFIVKNNLRIVLRYFGHYHSCQQK
jgi:hypothetical protein